MKKFVQVFAFLSVLVALLSPMKAFAATIMYNAYYLGMVDQYRMDFTYPTGTTTYKLHFIGSSGTPYDMTISQAPTGIFYLTCNGTYGMYFYDSTGTMIGYFEDITTSQIASGSCSSYQGQTGRNDLQVFPAPGQPDPESTLFQFVRVGPSSDPIGIWRDGVHVTDTTSNSWAGPSGSYFFCEYASSNSCLAQSDISTPTYDGTKSGSVAGTGDNTSPTPVTPPGGDPTGGGTSPGDGGTSGTCDGCQILTQMLDCPGWDEAMGDITQTIKDALPTLPEWRSIADQFVDSFSDYAGDAPSVPSASQIATNITPAQPVLDISTPNVQAAAPSDFDIGPLPFDVTTGPQIPVVDESQPIEIYEPDKYIHADTAGQMVFPGDTRNNSDGIKQPDRFTSPYASPVPTKTSDSTVPPSDVPIPTGTGGTAPTPAPTTSTIPIPSGGITQ